MDLKTLVCFVAIIFSNVIAGRTPSVCPKIVSRNEWGARSPTQVEYAIKPVQYVVIHHTVTPECNSERACIDRIFNIQAYHIDSLNFNDIAYNFMIGSDGQVYEGAGWHKIGSHTVGYNSKSIGIGFIGNFDDVYPSSAAVRAAKKLLECGVAMGELQEHYKLIGARQVRPMNSPGLKLYREIQTWPNWIASP